MAQEYLAKEAANRTTALMKEVILFVVWNTFDDL